MRMVLSLLIAAVVAFGLAGCRHTGLAAAHKYPASQFSMSDYPTPEHPE